MTGDLVTGLCVAMYGDRCAVGGRPGRLQDRVGTGLAAAGLDSPPSADACQPDEAVADPVRADWGDDYPPSCELAKQTAPGPRDRFRWNQATLCMENRSLQLYAVCLL